MVTKNLHTTSYNGSLIVLCYLTRRLVCVTRRLVFVTRRLEFVTRGLVFVTHRLVFVTCRLVFATRRLVFVTHRLVFVTRRLVFVTRRLVFVTRGVQKWPYVKFSNSFIFVSLSETPTGILFPQSIHLCYIGVLWSIRVGNYLHSSFRFGECGFAKVVLIAGYVSPYSYDVSMCASWRLSYASMT